MKLSDFPWGEPSRLLRNVLQPQEVFAFKGRLFPYFLHGYHSTYRNERCVEIPIVLEYLRSGPDTLEVGNVLNHYVRWPHVTVDKYERYPGVLNVDVVDYRPGRTFDRIISISTLEHVGWDEPTREPEKFSRAVHSLAKLLAPGGRFVFTVPIGWNTWMDAEIRAGRLPVSQAWYLRRTSFSVWEECALDDLRDVRYNAPHWCANGIMVGEIQAPG
jgi:hypothetical protein